MASGLGYTLVGTGAILVYAGFKGYSVPDVIRNVVTGKPIGDNVRLDPLGATPAVPESGGTDGGSSGEADSREATDPRSNRFSGKTLAMGYGWNEGPEWTALEELWTRESSWDNHAFNKLSGAYGIPQALPYTKMPILAQPESAGGQSDAGAQILWGLDYIKGRYGSPRMALAFHTKNNWY